VCKKRFLRNNIDEELKQRICITKRCTRRPALTAARNVKFRLSRTVAGQFTAESATPNEDRHEGTKLFQANSFTSSKNNTTLFLFFQFDIRVNSAISTLDRKCLYERKSAAKIAKPCVPSESVESLNLFKQYIGNFYLRKLH
jgi:hypothetical protein